MTTFDPYPFLFMLVGLVAGLVIGSVRVRHVKSSVGMHLDATHNVLTVIRSTDPHATVPAKGVIDALNSIRRECL